MSVSPAEVGMAGGSWVVFLVTCNAPLAVVRQVDFTPKCRSQLMKQQKRRLGDWRLDFNLRTSCEADVEKHCRVRPPL